MSETGSAKSDQVEHLRDDKLDQVTGGAGFMYFKDVPVMGAPVPLPYPVLIGRAEGRPHVSAAA